LVEEIREFAAFLKCKRRSSIAPRVFSQINPTLTETFKVIFHGIQKRSPKAGKGPLILENGFYYFWARRLGS